MPLVIILIGFVVWLYKMGASAPALYIPPTPGVGGGAVGATKGAGFLPTYNIKLALPSINTPVNLKQSLAQEVFQEVLLTPPALLRTPVQEVFSTPVQEVFRAPEPVAKVDKPFFTPAPALAVAVPKIEPATVAIGFFKMPNSLTAVRNITGVPRSTSFGGGVVSRAKLLM